MVDMVGDDIIDVVGDQWVPETIGVRHGRHLAQSICKSVNTSKINVNACPLKHEVSM
jgi:hypothetical protein